MPLYDRSYRRWDGKLRRSPLRWIPMASHGIRLALRPKGSAVRTMVFYAFLFNRSPLGSAYAGGLPDIDRAWLLKIANGAWRTFGH